MPDCCGQFRTTRFCPNCGKALNGGPGDELLVFMRKSRQTVKTTTDRHKRMLADEGKTNREYHANHAKKGEANLAKWDRWIEWVEGKLVEGRK